MGRWIGGWWHYWFNGFSFQGAGLLFPIPRFRKDGRGHTFTGMAGELPTSNVTCKDEVAPANWQFLNPCFEWRLSSSSAPTHFTLETCHNMANWAKHTSLATWPHFPTSNPTVDQDDWCCSSIKQVPDSSGARTYLPFLHPHPFRHSHPKKASAGSDGWTVI